MITPAPDHSSLANLIRAEIARIDKEMKQLFQEKKALERQLMQLRSRDAKLKDVSRKNSVNRVLVESEIVETLTRKGRPITSKDMFRIVQASLGTLNENSFRTYLHRMKLRGLIESTGERGAWRLPSNN
jgi:hypothetical protein